MSVPMPLLAVQGYSALMTLEADASAASSVASSWSDADLTVRWLRGDKMRSTPTLMDEVSAALQFPHYFGSNWPALGECLADMEWLLPTTGLVVVIRDAADVLIEEPLEELKALVHVIDRASRDYAAPVDKGEWWDRPALPFHVVLQASTDTFGEVQARWRAAGADTAPLVG